jgi:hypothetical protein
VNTLSTQKASKAAVVFTTCMIAAPFLAGFGAFLGQYVLMACGIMLVPVAVIIRGRQAKPSAK